jgi:hypothetical protein
MVRTPLTALGLALTVLAPGLITGCSSKDDKVDIGVQAIIFASRAHTVVNGDQVSIDVAGGNGQVIDYERYVPGGSLNVLMPPRPDGTLYNLTKAFPEADFNGVDVAFDGKSAVFSMKKTGNDHFHIYTVLLDLEAMQKGGSYAPDLHQLTAGDQDDINPMFAAGRKIIFATNQMYTEMGTRADEYEHSRVVSQLASITVDGGDADRRLFSQNLSHTVAPFLRFDGKIGYSRWEHLGGVNDVKLFAANPDGTQMLAVAGQHGKPGNSIVNVKEIGPNQMIGIVTTRSRTIHAGSLVLIDSRNKADAVCMGTDTNAMQGHACVDEENTTYTMLSPDVPTGNGPSPVGRYREPNKLPDGRFLVSWADGPVNDLSEQSVTPPDFGIYMYDTKTQKNQLVYNNRTMWDLNATAIAPHAEPPAIGDLQMTPDSTMPARIGSVNVTITSLQEGISGAQFKDTPLSTALKSAVKVRVIEGFSSEAAKGVTMFGLTMHEGAAILGETGVNADGSWLANVPPYIPMHLQPIDEFGLSIRSQGLWIQGEPGENRRCVGCHENRTDASVAKLAFGQNPTVAEQKGPENLLVPVADRTEYPWDMNDTAGKTYIQDILNKKCVSCHNGTTNGNKPQQFYTVTMTNMVTGMTTPYQIPYFDLEDKKMTVVYDRKTMTLNTSYVSIFYPSTIGMMMGKYTITCSYATGTACVPPMWGVPGDARNSEMIAHMNVQSADAQRTAWPTAVHPMHPENVGITLTPEERLALARSFDMGGQYYARQNTQFVPYASDPVKGASYK